jgi:maltose phosphorylase
MNQDYIKPDNWSIIEEGFDAESVKSSYSALVTVQWDNALILKKVIQATPFRKLYCRNILSDKTKVGWWKNGYPEYFAKVLNAPNWIGIDIEINGESLDLNTCTAVKTFVA